MTQFEFYFWLCAYTIVGAGALGAGTICLVVIMRDAIGRWKDEQDDR